MYDLGVYQYRYRLGEAMTPPSSDTLIARQPHTPATRFSCVGCGGCCRGRFVPLTLSEARIWLQRGDPVAVLIEAFEASTWPTSQEAYHYNVQRSAPVACGATTVNVTVILAAQAIPQCPNLQADNSCGIYTERPLVCRIYPMEISPFIALQPSQKDCPPESWQQGEVLEHDPQLAALIEASRQADRDDAVLKVGLCETLGLTVAAWKSDGLTLYHPDQAHLRAAIDTPVQPQHADALWQVQTQTPGLRERLAELALALDDREQLPYVFHPLTH